jgi:regulatory protein
MRPYKSGKTVVFEQRADAASARAAAVALLARRDFATAELCSRLRARGFEPELVRALSAQLEHEGLLSDARYAQNYVAYHAARGHGPLRIGAELRRAGLAADLVEAALDQGPDWRALARKVCHDKFGADAPEEWSQKARRARFLQYRGFSADHIRAATGVDHEAD